MCTWFGYLLPISLSRSAGTGSNIQSACPFSTWVTSASGPNPNFWMITSGFPAGCASFDQTLKYVFRTSLICLCRLYSTNLYGPVPGGGIVTAFIGVEAGRMDAKGTASFWRNSGSPFVRWKVTVLFASSGTTPFLERSQVAGVFRHAAAPTIVL